MSESGRVGESKRASEGRRVGESGSASEGRCAGVGKRGGAVEQPGQKPGSRGGGDGDTRYTVGQLASMAGVSARTLRYYEDMGLLRPRRTASNYRTYDGRDARRLAQILAMWACGLSVATIRHVLEDPDANLHVSLVAHLRTLRAQGRSVDEAIRRTERAIAMIEGMEGMDERSAFDELKTRTLQEFEATYGKEARELYGEEAIDAANERLRALTQDEWDAKGSSRRPSRCSCAWRWRRVTCAVTPRGSLFACTSGGFACIGARDPTLGRRTWGWRRLTWPTRVSLPTTTARRGRVPPSSWCARWRRTWRRGDRAHRRSTHAAASRCRAGRGWPPFGLRMVAVQAVWLSFGLPRCRSRLW